MAHQPERLPPLTMSDILWDYLIFRGSRPENYECRCCTKPAGTYVSVIAASRMVESCHSSTVAIVNLPCGCAAMGRGWWRTTPEALARLILVAEEKEP